MDLFKIIKIFIASPGDVVEERQLVKDVVNEENTNHFDRLGYKLEAICWETHSSPGMGLPHPQGRNNRLIDECALFIGILWCRFGSPTGVADSGTQEELEYALVNIGSAEAPLHDIMMFFCDYPISPSQIDVEQLGKVKALRERVRLKRFMDCSIKRKDVFKEEFRKHLREWFYDYLGTGGKKRLQSVSQPVTETSTNDNNPSGDEFRSYNRGF